MLFNSLSFIIFFAVVFSVYCVLRHRWQNRFLVIASYLFYGWWDARFLALIAVSTLVDFYVAQRMEAGGARRRWLWVSVGVNLSILGFFKYFGFFVESAVEALAALGFSAGSWRLDIALPVGISFYTLQTLGYTIDVYRGEVRAVRKLWDFALFVCFFPQLVAGPIERAKRLLPQIQSARRLTWDGVSQGCSLLMLGYFKKCAVADNLAPAVDRFFESPTSYEPWQLMLGLYAVAFQFYGDFSGYSDIARGAARLLGFDLMLNFRQPFFASSITDFWRRWHISLSGWLRDYVYFPLGGSRANVHRNLMLTMLLAGLWHGAAWTYVMFGALHGVYLVAERVIRLRSSPSEQWARGWRRVLSSLVTFHLFVISLALFRAESIPKSWMYLTSLVGLDGLSVSGRLPESLTVALAGAGVMLLLIDLPQSRVRRDDWFVGAHGSVRYVVCLVLVSWILLKVQAQHAFVYFQF